MRSWLTQLVDLIENGVATISRWALAPVFVMETAANAVRPIQSTSRDAAGFDCQSARARFDVAIFEPLCFAGSPFRTSSVLLTPPEFL